MPANVPNAVCGPQVNDTSTTPHGTDLSTLNKCPLNTCCDIWGQCGITADFCTPSNSTTGNPGTAAKGANGCLSNCVTDIVDSEAPAETYSVAYFEAFDQTRSCLTMSVDQINTTFYTHFTTFYTHFTTFYAYVTTFYTHVTTFYTHVTTFYTRVHFAFATITSGLTLNVIGIEDQLSPLLGMTGIKRLAAESRS
ncbi:hypothetical protein BDW59DRAFT_158336 [Aspergillus cavernicola]|uniref:Chitin-binding type-1 domain-containing protein n=1 Tax=Aspergillus cavernicola TaxID=176166 RepID=A0ABR4IT01_9EURO